MADYTLKDPRTGDAVYVNKEHMLLVTSVTQPSNEHINGDEGEYYSVIIDKTATAADDCIGYCKNLSDQDLIIDSVSIYSATATAMTIKLGDTGTANAPTTLTPVNMHAGSGNAADATWYEGVELDMGGALAGGSLLGPIRAVVTTQRDYTYTAGVIVPKNQVATFYVDQNANAVQICVYFGFHNIFHNG